MQTMDIGNYALVAAHEAESDIGRSWTRVAGYQYEKSDGGTDRFVSASFHGSANALGNALYAALHLTPDEARGLAYRLLDAADDADENLDAPVEYALTGKR